jgi:hypothetical protein
MADLRNTNETIEIEVSSPLVRPGLCLRTKTSKRYAADAAADLITIARAINAPKEPETQQ